MQFGAPNATYKNSSIGNVVDEKGMLATASCTGCTIDNVNFHDVLLADPSIHNECLYSQAANITIKNSRFTNCATMDVFFTRGTWWNQPAVRRLDADEQLLRRAALRQQPLLPLLRGLLGLAVGLRPRGGAGQHLRDEGDVRRRVHEQRRVLQHARVQPAGHGQGGVRHADADADTDAPTPTAAPTATPTATPSQDTQAPSVPSGMAWNGTTQTSIALRWNASTDNRGVTGLPDLPQRHGASGRPRA